MPDTPLFPHLPADARCWIYVADAPLDEATQEALLQHLSAFFKTWSSHQQPVEGAATIRDDRFLIVAATLEDGTISGCGIDSLTHAIDDAASDLGAEWAPALNVCYRDADGNVRSVSRNTFRTRVKEETVTAQTSVFDPSLNTLDAVRKGFEQPAGDTWHARIFRIPTLA
jgi:hypothetical protein